MHRAALVLLIGVVAIAAGCGGSSSTAKSPQGDPTVVAKRFFNNILAGYLDAAQNDLSPVSGVDVRSLTDLSIGLQTGQFREVGEPTKRGRNYYFLLDGVLRGKRVHLTYAVSVAQEVGNWRVVAFRLVTQARPGK